MEIAEVKKTLKSAWYCDVQVKRELDELTRLRALTVQVTPSYSLAPGGSGNNQKLEDNVIRIVEAERKCQQTVRKLLDNIEQVHALIDLLDDEQLKLLLKLRYINYMKWEDIALMLNYTWRRVNQLHGKALRMITDKQTGC